jgi:hypothetical protein
MNTPPLDTPLYEKLTRMRIEPDGAALTFPARLARENGWSITYAQRVVREYARFLYLAAKAGHSVTPSDEVDQAWHLHLAYTRHYWSVLCDEILGAPLHHGPTTGGAVEGQRYRAQYRDTLNSYRLHFGEDAPPDIWPGEERRFAASFTRVEHKRYFVIPKSLGYAAIAAPFLASCVMVGASSTTSNVFVMLVILAGVMLLVKGLNYLTGPPDKKNEDGSGCSGGCSSSDGDSGCGGGCGD